MLSSVIIKISFNVQKNETPTKNPPIMLANVPIKDTPPFVPFGTLLNLVKRTVILYLDSGKTVPNSEASVSPHEQLNDAVFVYTMKIIKKKFLFKQNFNFYLKQPMHILMLYNCY